MPPLIIIFAKYSLKYWDMFFIRILTGVGPVKNFSGVRGLVKSLRFPQS